MVSLLHAMLHHTVRSQFLQNIWSVWIPLILPLFYDKWIFRIEGTVIWNVIRFIATAGNDDFIQLWGTWSEVIVMKLGVNEKYSGNWEKIWFLSFIPPANISVHWARLPNSAPRKMKILRGSCEVQWESCENENSMCLVFLIV